MGIVAEAGQFCHVTSALCCKVLLLRQKPHPWSQIPALHQLRLPGVPCRVQQAHRLLCAVRPRSEQSMNGAAACSWQLCDMQAQPFSDQPSFAHYGHRPPSMPHAYSMPPTRMQWQQGGALPGPPQSMVNSAAGLDCIRGRSE